MLTKKSEIPPILILAFNRPLHLRRLIDHLRTIAPPIIYCAQDGPRESKSTDKDLCSQVTKLWDQIDWKCEKRTLIRKKNLGCQQGVSTAINWFFEHEEAGIILEDDCIPDPSFFPYCSELLGKYATEGKVMHISGDNFCPDRKIPHDASYRFSHYPHCWGWATWRRAWKHFDVAMNEWPEKKENGWLSSRFDSPLSRYFWTKMFDGVYGKKIDSWAIAWVYSCWNNGGVSILPNKNLVTNIGFDKSSTHTPDPSSPLANRKSFSMVFPLVHPEKIQTNRLCDAYDQLFVYEQRTPRQLLSFLKRKFQSLLP